MRHPLNTSWKIMNDPAEPRHFRADAEAEVREHANVGMFPEQLWEKAVVDACKRVRKELGLTIGPQPIRFTDKELHLMIASVSSIEYGDAAEIDGILNKLNHREKTMRNARSRDRRR